MMHARRLEATLLVAALLAVSGVLAVGTGAAVRMPAPGGGNTGGSTWSFLTRAHPCNVPNVTTPGSCFFWSEKNSSASGPWIVNLTDTSTFVPIPSNETYRTGTGDFVFNNGTSHSIVVANEGRTYVDFTVRGNYTVTDSFTLTICSASNASLCWTNITVSHSPVEVPFNIADCTIRAGCNPHP
jgi:hypothetical protein